MTPEPAQPAESPEARALIDEFVDFARYLRNAPANPLDEKREVSVRMILTLADALAATTARPTERGAVEAIAAERKRQIEVEGWSLDHDDQHSDGSMAVAAATYALGSVIDPVERSVMDSFGASGTPYKVHSLWPWDMAWFKPKSRRSDLVRAGALIVAEIERLDRMEKANG